MLKRLSSFTRTFILTVILVLIAILAVWFLGPKFGLAAGTVKLLLILILAVGLLIIVTQFVISRIRISRSARHASQSDSNKNLAGSAEIAALDERLDRAVHWLRKSKLAESGRDVVYDLPWYLLIGPQGAGKSTLLVQSGYGFSYTDPKKVAGKLDFGPTANCDLWLANEALFVDPSGKYLTENQESNTCLNMLKQIKEHRPKKPVDGILLVVDTAKLFSLGDDGIRDQANGLRVFLDMTMNTFGMVIPIYLIFNKSDLIDGFQEFFSKPGDRENLILGATFTRNQFEVEHPEKVFQDEFEQICQSVRAFGVSRLIEQSRRLREKTFQFAQQLSLMKDRLSEFVGILFQHSQFREKPLFRGFYFTSGIQGGNHLDLISRLLSSKAGLPVPDDIKGVRGTESYFIKSILTRIILPDRKLAGLSASVRRRRRLWRMIIAGAAGVILPLILLLSVWAAYRDNSQLIHAAGNARDIPIENGKSSDNLLSLSELKEGIERLDCQGKSESCRISGRRFHWGLYVGDEALAEARKIYLAKLNRLFMDQLMDGDLTLGHKYNGLKTQLRIISSTAADQEDISLDSSDFDPGRTYTLLKTVMMLSNESKASPAFLEEQLTEYWLQGVQEKDKDQATELLRFYLHQLGDHHNPDYRLPANLADEELARRIRAMLLVVKPDLYYYGIIQEEGDHKINLVNLTGIVGVENTGIFDAGAEIDGTYTKVGWETMVRDRINEMKNEYESERSWVLGITASEPGQPKIDEELRRHYFQDYQNNWWNFLHSIDIVPFANFQDASEKLAVLSDARMSPIITLTKAASSNTWDSSEEFDVKDAESIRNVLDGDSEARTELAESFQSIHDFVKEGEDQPSALSQYLKALSGLQVVVKSFLDAGQPAAQIQGIGQEAETTLRITNGLLVGFDVRSRQSIEPLLKQPIQHVLSLVDRATPVGAIRERKSTLIVGGIVKDKDKTKENVSVSLLQVYEDDKYEADKEIMRAQAQEGVFQFPNPVNPGAYKICASEDNDNSHYCGDVRLARENDGKVYELKRARSRILFGGGKRQLTLNIK